jgi:hypothetical protein
MLFRMLTSDSTDTPSPPLEAMTFLASSLPPTIGVVGKIVDPYAVVTVAQVPEAVRIGAD